MSKVTDVIADLKNIETLTSDAQTQLNAKAPLASPVFTGNVTGLGVSTGTSFNAITGLASVTPVAPAVTGVVGTSTLTARQDHAHPTNFTSTATDIKMDGTQAVGTLTTFPRADHVHPSDTSKLALAGGSMTGALNTARATVASSATTSQIWTALGNQIDYTGTATTTAFPAAPQAGAERTLICAGACSFTAGTNMLIDGVASGNTTTCAAGDTVVVRAISTVQFKLSRIKYDGSAQVGTLVNNTLTSTSTTEALSAAQGKILADTKAALQATSTVYGGAKMYVSGTTGYIITT